MYTAPLKAFLAKTAELKDKVGSNIIINISLGLQVVGFDPV
jgi:hypothetical protein